MESTRYEYYLNAPNPDFTMARFVASPNTALDLCEIEIRKHETEVKDKIKEVIGRLIDETPLEDLCEKQEREYHTVYKISFDIHH